MMYHFVVYSYEDACTSVVCEKKLETEQTCNILTPTLMAISVVSFSFSRVDQPEARGPSILLSAGFLYHTFTPTRLVSKLNDFLSSSCYIIDQRQSSCGRHKLHSFNPSTVKVILCYSSTVIYIGAFPILTTRPGRWSIYNNLTLSLIV